MGGLLVAVFSRYMDRIRRLKHAESEARELMERTQEEAQSIEEQAQAAFEEYKEELQKQFENETFKIVQRNDSKRLKIDEKEEALKAQWQLQQEALDRRQSAIQQRDHGLQNKNQKLAQLKQRTRDLYEQYKNRLIPQSQSQVAELKNAIEQELIEEARKRAIQSTQSGEEDMQLHLEREAKHTIRIGLNRFARPYCAERGIGHVSFETRALLDRVVGPNRVYLSEVEKACGVDVSINEEYLSLNVLGFDPVRRELGRAVLEALSKDKHIDSQRIHTHVDRLKRDLLKKIQVDGQKVARELSLQNFHPEVMNMLGALRYRYSFAQNQHFHCAEVGWLCGLLSAELGLPIKDGRRSGLLHDIGKAMDHSRDGGHAVIGADFIQKHGEAEHIVHAVRAHHFDEQPSTDLAYLVIAADAISGARPGARRSTIDSYTQKMADLEKIASSFDGVLAAYILSAGREVRVIVDSATVDDHKALELSKKIAHKIEDECSYPGLIRVTVVRETQAVEFAR